MRIVRFLDDRHIARYGVEIGPDTARILDFDPNHPLIIGDWLAETWEIAAQGHDGGHAGVHMARRLVPVPAVNIIAVAANYAAHIREAGRTELPEYPVLFMKPTTTLLAAGEAIRIPAVCEEEVDYECELAVVIGRQGRDIAEADALDYVLGYTIANDVSARKWQKVKGGGQFVRGKGFDTFCPLGPTLVTQVRDAADVMRADRTLADNTADGIGDPQQLHLTTTLNGETMQNGCASDMIFNVRQLISFISRDTTLLPGTVILTGTPSGVGAARKPPVWLKPGDRLELAIDPIGTLANDVSDHR